jgi:hypothetical protein
MKESRLSVGFQRTKIARGAAPNARRKNAQQDVLAEETLRLIFICLCPEK